MKKFLFLLSLILLFPPVSAQCFFYLLEVDTDFSTLPENVFPGDVVSLNIPLENTSEGCAANDVVAEISLNENYFEVEKLADSISIINSNETKTLVFNFKVKEETLPGSYKFSVNLLYLNRNQIIEDATELTLDVQACYSLDIENISYSVDSVYAGEKIRIFADVKNICSGVARDVEVELKPITNSTFDPFIVLSSNLLQIGDISSLKSAPISFSLKPIKDAEPKIYVFEIDANCFDCETTSTDTISFEVLSKPDLIFSGIDFSNETRAGIKSIFPGDSFSFSVQIDNIGKEIAKAVKVSLVTDDEIGGTKEEFVGNIDPDDSGAAIFDLTMVPTAKVGEHEASINVEYIDEVGQTQQITESYTFYITQPPSDIGGLIFLLILIIIVLVILYFIIKMVFRQLALRKAKLR